MTFVPGSFVKFLVVGTSNTVLSLIVMYIAWTVYQVGDLAANTLGYTVGFLWGYAWNRRWTFNAHGGVKGSFRRYLLVCAFAYAANLLVLFAARSVLGSEHFWPHLFGIAAYTVLAYLGSLLFAFKAMPGSHPCQR